jgi:hypothetical protein
VKNTTLWKHFHNPSEKYDTVETLPQSKWISILISFFIITLFAGVYARVYISGVERHKPTNLTCGKHL